MKKARDILIYFSYKYNGDYNEILKALKKKEKIDDELYEQFKEKWEKKNVITIIDENYPETFKTINFPPIVLYLKGQATLLEDITKSIAIIGARESTKYGEQMTRLITEELASDHFTIVSGLARGIDSFAHHSALSVGGKTIAVLGSGIDYVYPLSNRELYRQIAQSGLIISEYPDFTKPAPENFKFRNRLIAALSKAVLITEAKHKSGTMVTVGFALEKGNDVFCIPHLATSGSGCNKLIKDGAYLVESAKDIINLWSN